MKAGLNGVVIVENYVRCPHEIEGDDKSPEQRTYPSGEKRQNGQHSGRKVSVGCKDGEARREVRTDNPWKNKDEPEEAKAVHGSDDAMRIDPVHRLESGPEVGPEVDPRLVLLITAQAW